MPFNHNASRRHRIGKMKFKVANWAEYEAGLRRRGSLTLWMTPEALSSWPAPRRTTRDGQPRHSDLAIETALTLGLVFGLRLRQTEGFFDLLAGLDLAVPDNTTLSRRANKPRAPNKHPDRGMRREGPVRVLIDSTGLQRWPMAGGKAWCQIPSGVAQAAPGAGCRQRRYHCARHDGPGCRRRLAGRAAARPDLYADRTVTANGAYDGEPIYDAVTKHSADAAVSLDRKDADPSRQRNRHIAAINADGRTKWQAGTGYGKPSLAETAIGRYKSIIGHRLRARSFDAQQTEVAFGCAVLNRMLACARPKSAPPQQGDRVARNHKRRKSIISAIRAPTSKWSCTRKTNRNLVPGRGSDRSKEQDHPPLGKPRLKTVRAARPANAIRLHLRAHLP